MTMKKFYTEDMFGLLIDLRSMPSQTKHDGGTRLVNMVVCSLKSSES